MRLVDELRALAADGLPFEPGEAAFGAQVTANLVRLCAAETTGAGFGAPPPLLAHASRLPSSWLLYGPHPELGGARVDPDVAYAPGEWEPPAEARVAGVAMLGTCGTRASAAVVYAVGDPVAELVLWVPGAPLGAAENEAFSARAGGGAFAERLYNHAGPGAAALRSAVGAELRACGRAHTPDFLLTGAPYRLERSGSLPLLRVFAPTTGKDARAAAAALAAAPGRAHGAAAPLAALPLDDGLTLRTVLVSGEAPPPAAAIDPLVEAPVLDALAEAVLLRAHEPQCVAAPPLAAPGAADPVALEAWAARRAACHTREAAARRAALAALPTAAAGSELPLCSDLLGDLMSEYSYEWLGSVANAAQFGALALAHLFEGAELAAVRARVAALGADADTGPVLAEVATMIDEAHMLLVVEFDVHSVWLRAQVRAGLQQWTVDRDVCARLLCYPWVHALVYLGSGDLYQLRPAGAPRGPPLRAEVWWAPREARLLEAAEDEARLVAAREQLLDVVERVATIEILAPRAPKRARLSGAHSELLRVTRRERALEQRDNAVGRAGRDEGW